MHIAKIFYDEDNIGKANCACGLEINKEFRLIIHIYPFFDIINEILVGFRVEEELQGIHFGDGISFKRIHTAEHTIDINELNSKEEYTIKLTASWGLGISINLIMTLDYDIECGFFYDIEVEKEKSEKKKESIEDNILNRISFF